ncbi:MAG: membrane protein insertion efficiency factor YidD [Pedosphaera sp.]|nr:membrane protein insertion efficiency factor YidD [Pedosphaera sp.]
MQGTLLLLLWGYRRFLSPLKQGLLGPQAVCRFAPSCSAYALESVTRHGPVTGSVLAVQRLCRCHPWNAGGWDPVPTQTHRSHSDRIHP